MRFPDEFDTVWVTPLSKISIFEQFDVISEAIDSDVKRPFPFTKYEKKKQQKEVCLFINRFVREKERDVVLVDDSYLLSKTLHRKPSQTCQFLQIVMNIFL